MVEQRESRTGGPPDALAGVGSMLHAVQRPHSPERNTRHSGTRGVQSRRGGQECRSKRDLNLIKERLTMKAELIAPKVESTTHKAEFIAHNIRLDDGTLTKPGHGQSVDEYPWFVSARRVLDTVFPGDKSKYRVADLGCLEGGYAVEFARMGFQTLGLEVRESNIAACRYVKERTNLPNLNFVRDDAWNVQKYGTFDAVFC